MHLILVSDRLATAKSITLSVRHLILGIGAFALLVLGTATAFSYLTVRYAAYIHLPELHSVMRSLTAEDNRGTAEVRRGNMNGEAVLLREVQAQQLRGGARG